MAQAEQLDEEFSEDAELMDDLEGEELFELENDQVSPAEMAFMQGYEERLEEDDFWSSD